MRLRRSVLPGRPGTPRTWQLGSSVSSLSECCGHSRRRALRDPGNVDGRRVIAHLDLDAFYASVELLRDPSLRGKPVIVSGSGPRAVVTTCTYEARAFGVHSAMPASQARRLCPHAIAIRPDFPAYREASRRVWEI